MFSSSVFHRTRIILFCLLGAMLLVFPAFSSSPVTKVDLGVNELTLEVGESYAFQVSYEPEKPSFHALKWNVSDDSILEIDPVHFSVTALKAGTARILAESFDGYAYDVCTVTVNGSLPKDGSVMKSGSSFITLSAADRAKITSFSIKRYLDFLEGTDMTDEAFAESAGRSFMVMAAVTPGTEDAQSQLALSLGMKEAEPLRNLHVLTLRGTLDQILKYTAGNDDLKEVYEEHFVFAEKRTESENNVQKTLTLEGHTEELTSVSTAHAKGFTGKGTTVAVIDTGIFPEHPEFEDRVIGQRCFGTDDVDEEDGTIFHSPCVSEDNAYPEDTLNMLGSFSHGSHAAGIAAGKGGIAPEANIVAIQVFTDIMWTCTEDDLFFDWCPWEEFPDEGEEEPETRQCCTIAANPQDTARAYDYLIGYAQEYPNLTAVNLSMANNIFHETACDDIQNYDYFQSLLEKGIIPVLASGNEYTNDTLPESACTSNSYAVGALSNKDDPILAPFSNHNDLIDMAAPGVSIVSSIIPRTYDHDDEVRTVYYEDDSGTSMAAPMVTGAFAIMKQIFPNRSPEQLKQTLKDLSTKDVTQRSACRSMDYGCPEEYKDVTSLSAAKPILDFSNLEAFLAEDENAVVAPVVITVIGADGAAISSPEQFFSLLGNGEPVDLSGLDIMITEKTGNRIVFTISGLPAFDEDNTPIAYSISPVDNAAKVSGTVYDGYVIRINTSVPFGITFFRFPEELTELPRTGFSALQPWSLTAKPESLNYDQTGLVLEIPSLNVITKIVQVPFSDNEYPVQWLDNAAGLLEGSAMPGEGVSVLTGHNHLSTTEAGPFAFLSELETGTKIYVLDRREELTSFTVVGNELIGADDMAALEALANQFENTLTLVTCENELPQGGYANRRVVAAIPD